MAHIHSNSIKNIRIAFFLNLIFTIAELIGGVLVNSVAILSDAIHDLGDSFSLGIAWYLQNKSEQKADHRFSFGYARFSLLGALINSIVLIVGSIIIISQAIERIITPEPVHAQGMMGFAILGIAVNGYAAWKLSSGKTQNEKVVTWHLLEDVLGWVMILITSLILQFKDIPILDPALSMGITLFILWNVFKRLKETLFLFLQGTPDDIDLNELKSRFSKIENVDSLHHTHVWSLEGHQHVFTTHVKLAPITSLKEVEEIKCRLKEILSEYSFKHYSIEIELHDEPCGLPDH